MTLFSPYGKRIESETFLMNDYTEPLKLGDPRIFIYRWLPYLQPRISDWKRFSIVINILHLSIFIVGCTMFEGNAIKIAALVLLEAIWETIAYFAILGDGSEPRAQMMLTGSAICCVIVLFISGAIGQDPQIPFLFVLMFSSLGMKMYLYRKVYLHYHFGVSYPNNLQRKYGNDKVLVDLILEGETPASDWYNQLMCCICFPFIKQTLRLTDHRVIVINEPLCGCGNEGVTIMTAWLKDLPSLYIGELLHENVFQMIMAPCAICSPSHNWSCCPDDYIRIGEPGGLKIAARQRRMYSHDIGSWFYTLTENWKKVQKVTETLEIVQAPGNIVMTRPNYEDIV